MKICFANILRKGCSKWMKFEGEVGHVFPKLPQRLFSPNSMLYNSALINFSVDDTKRPGPVKY